MRHFMRTILAAALIGWLLSWAPVMEALAGPDQPEVAVVTVPIPGKPMVKARARREQRAQVDMAVPVYDIPLAEALQVYTYERCQDAGVDYELVLALMGMESGYQTDAVSETGDYGLMQINECNHGWLRREQGVTDFLDPEQSIQAGVYLLGELTAKFEDPNRVLMAYNMGEAGAQRLWEAGAESSEYSRAVMVRREELLREGR